MILDEWAKKWGVNTHALQDLKLTIRGNSYAAPSSQRSVLLTSEADVQKSVQTEALAKGSILWRNNVGAMRTNTGGIIRFGLNNISKKQNSDTKSADLIGIKKVKITQDMVGKSIGQFLSREIKSPSWKFSGTPRELAQLNWVKLVLSYGGDALITNRNDTI